MASVKIAEIDERLPPAKLSVYDLVSYLLERDLNELLKETETDSQATMLASESVLRRDWDRPEENSAWAYL